MTTDWIEQFIQHTDSTTSPALFRKWAAISAVAGALERKVWVRSLGSNLYPNMYVVLVAPPGIGKTEATWRVDALWRTNEDLKVAPSSVTKASLIDSLNEAHRRVLTNNPEQPVVNFNSLLMSINELGVLIPAYENEFMNTLTDLWDCKGYSEKRRSTKLEIDIPNPQITMLAACTPSYLMSTLPEGAWDQGFLSRTMLIYSGDRQLRSLFAEQESNEAEWDALVEGLGRIGNLYGEIKFTQDAAALMDDFHMSGGAPQPDHPKLFSYNVRRTVHLLKLCMVCSVSRSDELVVTEEDFSRAKRWLLEAESAMPDVFKAMTQGGAMRVIEEAWHFLYKAYVKDGKPVLESRLIRFLQERVPVHSIEPTIDMMVKGRMIEVASMVKDGASVGKAYKPKGKRAGA